MITNTQILNDGKVVTIEAEGGWSGPVRLPAGGQNEIMERMKPTQDASPFTGLCSQGLGLPQSTDNALADVTGRDTIFERRELAGAYQEMAKGLMGDVSTSITAAGRILKDSDLKDEVKAARAAEKLAPALEALPKVFERALEPLQERAELLTLAVTAALLPAPTEGMGAMIRELRAGEIRRAAEAMPENDRHAFALRLAGNGKIDALHALDDDPSGRAIVDADTLTRAREVALRKIGGADLLSAWRDSLVLLEKAAATADVLSGQIMRHMPVKSAATYPGQTQATKRRIADMTKRARVNPWRADAA